MLVRIGCHTIIEYVEGVLSLRCALLNTYVQLCQQVIRLIGVVTVDSAYELL